MSKLESCPDCGEAVFEETCGAENNKVCTNCGYTTSICELSQAHEDDFGSSYHNESQLTQKYKITCKQFGKPICKNQRDMLTIMQGVLEHYPNNKELYKTAKELFLKICARDECHYKRIPFKTAVAACTTLTVLRGVGVQVTMPKICDEFQISTKLMMVALKMVKKYSTIQPKEDFSIKDCLEPYLEHHTSEERLALKNLSVAISKLFIHLKVTQSREVLAAVSFYFALISDPPQVSPFRITRFVKKYRVPSFRQTTVKLNIASARSKIFILAKRLPWVTSTVKSLNCHVYITDILKWKNILIKDGEEDDNDEVATSSENVVITEQMKLTLPKIYIKRLKNPPISKNDESPEPEAVSRSEEITEDEFSHQEISELLRTQEEIDIVSKIRHNMSLPV